MVRKRYLQETMGEDALASPPRHAQEKITRQSLEEEARLSTMEGHGSLKERFWNRQRSWEESAMVGIGLIQRMAAGGQGKKEL